MPLQSILFGLGIVLAGLVLWRVVRVWSKYRGRRVVTCPENMRPAGVELDAAHAVASALQGVPELRLSSCSRWPERADCGQQCIARIVESPEGCLVRNILTDWYRDKACATCGRPFGEIEWAVQKPALLGPGKISLEWNQVPADKLHEVLAASLPLCFACHMASTLVREHPELAIDRSPSH